MNEALIEYKKRVEFVALGVNALLILGLALFKLEWVLSAVIGFIAALISFRLQVSALIKFEENPKQGIILRSQASRLFQVGVIFFIAFIRQPILNPFVVFAFLILFNLLIVGVRFVKVTTVHRT